MADFQVLQAVTSVKNPFSDITDIRRESNSNQVITFEKSTFIQNFQ